MGIASDFVLIILAGLLGAALARVLRLPLIVGYVVAGVAVGPNTAGPTVVQVHDIELLAEIGVALLLFSIGLEISFADLKPVQRVALVGGGLQIILVIALASWLARGALGSSLAESLWLGSMMALSSTMVVLKALSGSGLMTTLASRVMIGILVVQDLAVIPMLVVLPQMEGGGDLWWSLIRSLAVSTGLIAATYLVGTRLLPPLLRQISAWGPSELFLVAVVAISVGFGAAAHAVGISFALGAFLGGLVLSESEFSHQALADVIPLRDIFGLLFFVSVGMLFDPQYAAENWRLILAVVALVIFGKAAVIGWTTRALGYVNLAPFIVGFGLAQIGEFSFVLARAGLNHGLQKSTYDLVLTVTVLTMALSPLTASLGLRLGRWWRSWRRPSRPAPAIALKPVLLRDHVIVAGYGRTGRSALRVLERAKLPVVAVESSYPNYRDVQRTGALSIWGDISREEILHAAGVERARTLLLTMPDPPVVELAIQRAKRMNPELRVIARTPDPSAIPRIRQLGADSVVLAEYEASVAMVRRVLEQMETDSLDALKLLKDLRMHLYDTDDGSHSPPSGPPAVQQPSVP